MSMQESGPPLGGPETAEVPAAELQTPPNVRAILRVGSEFFLRAIDSMAAVQGDNLLLALVFSAMWTANVKHITYSAANTKYGGLDDLPPDELRKPVSILALSNSLRMPYETVRRHVHALVRKGDCVRIASAGFMVPAAVHNRQSNRNAVQAGLPNLLRFVTDLKRAGFDFEPYRRALPQTVALPPAGIAPSNMRALLRVGMETIMRGIDTQGSLRGDDFLAGLIYTSIWTANVHHITSTGENMKFGALREVPLDDVRRPVTVNAIARALRVPYETVRRYTNKLVTDGVAVRIKGKGLIIPRDQLAQTESYDGVRRSYNDIVRMISELHRAGFDFRNY